MTVYALKPAFQSLLRPVAGRMVNGNWTANRITAAGFAASVLTGGAFALGSLNRHWLMAVPVLLFLRLALNALDGIVAREHNQASTRGRIYNEVADVMGDAVAYLPVVAILPEYTILIATVVVLATVTEFVAVLDPNLRRNEGPLGKSDRAIGFGLLAMLIATGLGPGTWTIFFLLAMAAAALLTIHHRTKERT